MGVAKFCSKGGPPMVRIRFYLHTQKIAIAAGVFMLVDEVWRVARYSTKIALTSKFTESISE